MEQVISSHPAWQRRRDLPILDGNSVWPTTCIMEERGHERMADYTRQLSQEYWRQAPAPGNESQTHSFQPQGNPAFCSACGTQYPGGARFCHLCGLGREDDLRVEQRRVPGMDWLNFEHIGERTGLSTISLILVLSAIVFALASVMTGLVYSTSTIAEWQAVQTWKVEWLLATMVALLAAMLFKKS